ncbi:MAG: hypothetical protein WDZ35_10320 [Crocinitomicaceae bacterium]
MKKALLFLGIATLLLSFNSCKKYKNKEVYANVPVYMDYESFRNSFAFQQGVPVENAGNIFLHNHYILISDTDKGIHVYDNSEPQYPVHLGFMNIPGNTQMAVKGNLLYADSFIDLVVIDLSNMSAPQLISRMENVFTYSLPAIDEKYPVADIYKDKGVVIDWNIEKTKEVSGFMNKVNVADCDGCGKEEVETKSAVTARVNLAGSRSQFAIVDNYLYTIDMASIKSFNISSPSSPSFGGEKTTWAELETMISEGDHLFLGTTTGMLIYDTEGNRDFPVKVSEIEHVESCDPVIVVGDYAYLTLRSGNDCGGEVNEFQVIDVSDRKSPTHKKSFDMYDPHGLGADGDLLFICDGSDGLKIFDISDPEMAGYHQLYFFPEIQSSDIILHNGLAIMIAEEGIYQYDYSDPSAIYMINMLYF